MQHLVISALGSDQPGIVDALSEAVFDAGCNIADSRMTVLGGEFATLLLVSGNWNNIAKLEQSLPKLSERLGLTTTTKRTQRSTAKSDLLPYMVEVISLDHPGIVHNLANFFASRGINIQELTTTSYAAAHTLIAALRDEFLDFCEQLNLDAIIEPVKG